MLACYGLAQVRAEGENDNDTDCFCDGGRSVGFRGRFRDFASCADRAADGRHCRRYRRRHAGVLLSPRLLPSALASLLLALRLSALLVANATRRRAGLTENAVNSCRAECPRRGVFVCHDDLLRRYFASHSGTRLSASLRAAGLAPPCARPDGSALLARPTRSRIGALARSNSWCAPG